jgi:uncharacterized protein (DUF4415 family)
MTKYNAREKARSVHPTTRPRGRPKKADAKVHIQIRLSPQVLGYFRATGPEWQNAYREVLRKWGGAR